MLPEPCVSCVFIVFISCHFEQHKYVSMFCARHDEKHLTYFSLTHGVLAGQWSSVVAVERKNKKLSNHLTTIVHRKYDRECASLSQSIFYLRRMYFILHLSSCHLHHHCRQHPFIIPSFFQHRLRLQLTCSTNLFPPQAAVYPTSCFLFTI